MRNRVILAILIVLLVFSLIIANITSSARGGSSFISTPLGLKALYNLLELESVPVHRWRGALTRFTEDQTQGTLLVIAPKKPVPMEELLKWVIAGNRLVYAAGLGNMDKRLQREFGVAHDIAFGQMIRLLSGVDASAEKVNCPATLQNICAGVAQVITPAISFVSKELVAEAEVLLGTREKPYLLRKGFGKGEIWLFSGSEPFENRYLDRNDTARFLFQLISEKSPVYFDEFHHGYIEPAPLERRSQWLSLLVLIIALLFWLVAVAWTRGVRFGLPSPLLLPSNAHGADFATVLGLLYADHGATHVLQVYVESWRQRAERAWGLSARTKTAEFLWELKKSAALKNEEVIQLGSALRTLESEQKGDLEAAVSILERVLLRS